MKLTPRNAARFRGVVQAWGAENRRDYPWRNTRSPYRILLSEVMLRRTRADQVVPVYRKVLRLYPTASKLAQARAPEIRKLLRPLGLVWRADNLVRMAEELRNEFACRVPTAPTRLKELTGVGDYVANAVACFAKGAAVAIVDTNVVRVIGRTFGLRLEGEARRRKEMIAASNLCLDRNDPRLYNYSILDFASLVCRARSPDCDVCPLGQQGACSYRRQAD